jgi:hypothetical protein
MRKVEDLDEVSLGNCNAKSAYQQAQREGFKSIFLHFHQINFCISPLFLETSVESNLSTLSQQEA